MITQSRQRGAQTTSAHLHWCGADPPSSWPAHVAGHAGDPPKRGYVFAIFAGFLRQQRDFSPSAAARHRGWIATIRTHIPTFENPIFRLSPQIGHLTARSDVKSCKILKNRQKNGPIRTTLYKCKRNVSGFRVHPLHPMLFIHDSDMLFPYSSGDSIL